MAENADISAWILFFVGLYALAAAAGELRDPETWSALLDDLERSPGLRFLTGVVVLALGAAIYLASPWRAGDGLSIAASVIGGVTIAEGLLLLAAGDRVIHIGRALIDRAGRALAGFAFLFGAALVLLAMSRLQPL